MDFVLTPALLTAIVLGIFLLGFITSVAIDLFINKKWYSAAKSGPVIITVRPGEAGALTFEVDAGGAKKHSNTIRKIIFFILAGLWFLIITGILTTTSSAPQTTPIFQNTKTSSDRIRSNFLSKPLICDAYKSSYNKTVWTYIIRKLLII